MIIGISSYDGWCRCGLAAFMTECSDARVVVIERQPIDVARNKLVAIAQGNNTNLMMIDADAIPAKGTYAALKEKVESEECVAGVAYLMPNGVVVNQHQPKEASQWSGWRQEEDLSTHCVAYNIRVFDRITRPYYYQEYNSFHTDLKGPAEDTVLHQRLSKAGVPLWCNYSLWAGHSVQRELTKPRLLGQFEKQLIFAGLDDYLM